MLSISRLSALILSVLVTLNAVAMKQVLDKAVNNR